MKRLLYIIFAIYIVSCGSSRKKDEGVVARVFDEYLYKSDLASVVPSGTNKKDSISIVRSFINNWIKQKLVIAEANNKLSSTQKDFEKQLNDYRNSLLVFEFEKQLISEKLDTAISDKEVKAYYEKNKNEFLLKDNIVKVWYVKLPVNSTNASAIRKLFKSNKPDSKQTLDEYCKKVAVNYYLEDSTWLYFNDLLKEIPIKTYNQEDYLKNHRFIEMEDSIYSYFVNIKGFQIKESVSPFDFERDNVRKIVLNKRKLKLIEDVQDKVFKDALKNKDFEIY